MQNLVRRAVLAFVLIAGLAPAIAQVPPPVPALPDTERRTTYTITASTCACAVNMAIYGDSTDYQDWLEIWINGVNIAFNDPALGWTITSPTGPLGNIARPITDAVLTFNNPQTGTIQIVGARRPRRTSQFSENQGVSARNLNQVITDIVAMLREVWDKINDVAGRVVRAPPGETLATLPPAASRANMGASFDSNGNLVPSVSIPSGSFNAGNGITFTGTGPTTISTSTFAPGTGIAFTGSNPTVISVGSSSNGVVLLPSRAVAVTLDLSAFSAITTQGYATPGDGGGATFKKVASSTPFVDSYITGTPTIVGGSGYTAGSYLGVALGGGHGVGCSGSATVSGGAITSVLIVVPCVGYQVGDVLVVQPSTVGGTGSGFTWTVTAISTPQASFVDAAGNHWQFITDQPGHANALQFGCIGNWNGVDASSFNNTPCLTGALAWAAATNPTSTAQVNGNQVILPKGAYMTCGLPNFGSNITFYLPISQGVRLTGVGVGGTTLVECAADNSGNHYIELCDSNAKLGQFGCKVEEMTINLLQLNAETSGIAAIFSNSGQQFPLAEKIELLAGHRVCVVYQIGKGGAANAIFNNIDCEQLQTTSNDGMTLNSSGTLITLRDSVFGAGGGTATHNAINLAGGGLIADGIEIEEATTGINISSSTGSSAIRNVNITNGCVNGVTLTSSNPNNNVLLENVTGSSCSSHLVNNGHSGGTSVPTGTILAPMVFNP